MNRINQVNQQAETESKPVMIKKVPVSLWKSVKRYAFENGVTATDVTVAALERFISQEASTDVH